MAILPPLAGVLQTLEIFRATSGTSLAYPFVTLDATGENDDRFRHDGGTRGTSIPLGFKRHFRPLPPQIIPARVRGSWTILPFPHPFRVGSSIPTTANHNRPVKVAFARGEINLQKFARCRIINCLF